MHARFRRSAALVGLFALATSGCYQWDGARVPGPGGAQRMTNPARVTLADGSVVVLHDAIVSNDSIVGYAGDRPGERERTAVAVSQVRKVEDRELNFPQTVVAATLATLAAVVLVSITILQHSLDGG